MFGEFQRCADAAHAQLHSHSGESTVQTIVASGLM